MKKFFFVVILLVISLTFLALAPKTKALSSEYVDCVGAGLAKYVADVFQALGISAGSSQNSFGNVKFLSPAFNIGEADFPALVEKFNTELGNQGYSLNNFAAIAGNAYNTPWGTISDFINTARSTPIGGRPIILTETGWYPHKTANRPEAISQLKNEFSSFPQKNIIGGLIFNVFGGNPSFIDQAMSDEEISEACGGSCFSWGIGANSAAYYSSPEEFYNRAGKNQMKYALEIARDDINIVMPGINNAKKNGLIPIVRIGDKVGGGGLFENPKILAAFIKELDSRTSGEIYIIIGPNEPLSETWATPQCVAEDFIIIQNASFVCSDKDVTHKEVWTKSVSPTPSSSPQFTIDQNSDANNKRVLGESSREVSAGLEGRNLMGEITINSSKISEFEPLQKRVSNALTKLLPQELSQDVVLPGTVTMNFYHRILGQDENGEFTKISSCDNTPYGSIDIPSEYWGKLAGSIRGLYGFLYPPDPDAPVSKFQFQIAPAENNCQEDYCPGCSLGGVNTQENNLTAIKNTKPEFSLSAFIKSMIIRIEETIGNVLTFLGLRHEETKEIRVLSRSLLPGGSETAENAKFFNVFMPAEIIETITPKNETKALAANYQYNISFSDSTTEDTPTFYYALEKLRNSSCMGLCSQLPTGVDIKDFNPICPSCVPQDYSVEIPHQEPLPSKIIPVPSGLRALFEDAAEKMCVPIELLTAISRTEGGNTWSYSDDEFTEFSTPGWWEENGAPLCRGLCYNTCNPGGCSSWDPNCAWTTHNGIYEEADVRGVMQFELNTFNAYRDHLYNLLGREPNRCLIPDSIYAAALKIKADSGTTNDQCTDWSEETVRRVARAYCGSCDSPNCPRYCDTIVAFYRSYQEE